jgi:6-phospho-beta-glucosidase
MKIAIVGAASARAPLLLRTLLKRQTELGLTDLALMDLDGERLNLIGSVTAQQERRANSRITRTTDARAALTGADFVITTFRVGGMEARVVDERVPLRRGVLGQETTGPGGFAMALRSIPVLLDLVAVMRETCPRAWLVNFANPAGMLAEAATRLGGWERVVGICDGPSSMARVAAALLGASPDELFLDYFGLNHLGWLRAVIHEGQDRLPQLIQGLQKSGGLPGVPFPPELMAGLEMVPNEYLFYYYATRQAVNNALRAPQTRGEQLMEANQQLFSELRKLAGQGEPQQRQAVYDAYLKQREQTYMERETLTRHDLEPANPQLADAFAPGEGYPGVALNVIEALAGRASRQMILNVPNAGAMSSLPDDAVVEIPAWVSRQSVRPMAVAPVPLHCLGLVQQVKAYERLTLDAVRTGSRAVAVMALAIHPLVSDYATARAIVDDYQRELGTLLPALT